MTAPKTVVLPLHHGPVNLIAFLNQIILVQDCECKCNIKKEYSKCLGRNFFEKRPDN